MHCTMDSLGSIGRDTAVTSVSLGLAYSAPTTAYHLAYEEIQDFPSARKMILSPVVHTRVEMRDAIIQGYEDTTGYFRPGPYVFTGLPGAPIDLHGPLRTELLLPFLRQEWGTASTTGLYRRATEALYPYTRVPYGPEVYQDGDYSIWFTIRDIIVLPALARQFSREVPRMLRAKQLASRTGRSSAGSLYLASVFGVLPTISGFKDLCETVRKWRKWLDDTRKGKVPRRYRRPVETWQTEVFGSLFTVDGFNGRFRYVTDHKVCQALHYELSCPAMLSWCSRLYQLLDRFGVLNPAAAWDLIPFSFIVDWYVSVSRFLSENRPRLQPMNLDITSSGCSYKEETVVDFISVDAVTGIFQSMNPITHVDLIVSQTIPALFHVKRYIRGTVRPSIDVARMSKRWKGGLSIGQVAIATALTSQFSTSVRIPNVKRGRKYLLRGRH